MTEPLAWTEADSDGEGSRAASLSGGSMDRAREDLRTENEVRNWQGNLLEHRI